jgi:hypothetical protein
LTTKFNGKWVAFVSRDAVTDEDVLKERERDGLVLLAGDSYEEVRAKVLELPCVLRAQPSILMVRGRRSAYGKGEE